LAFGSVVHAQAVRESTWVTDGTVNAIAGTGSTLFLGGNFSRIGPWVGGAGVVDRGTGGALRPYPRVAGTVFASAADGGGGWYIGGAFTRVQGQPRRNLAHLRADGTVDAWNPGADTTVRALAHAGSLVYAGGDFSGAGGAARGRLAAIDASTGTATAWDPEPNGPVMSLLVSGSTLYAGGSFRVVAGGAAPGVVSFDVSTGSRLPVPLQGPTSGGSVFALARSGNRLDVAGSFSHAGPPTGAGSFLDATTAAPVAPFFDVVGQLRAVESDGAGGWYLGGEFTAVCGAPRTNLAHVLADGGVAPWNPGTDDTVRAIAVTPARIYVGGDFNKCGGKPHVRIAAVDPANGSVLTWNPVLSVTTADSVLRDLVLRVNTLLLSGSTLYVGGGFTSVGGTPRENLAAFDVATGALLASQPLSTSGPVRALAAGGGNAFVGGSFNVMGTVAPGFVSVDASTGAMSPPAQSGITRQTAAVTPDGAVAGVTPDGAGGWYIGGAFTGVQGQARSNLAHIRADGSLDPWNPLTGTVYTLAIANGTLYVGGSFTVAGGQARTSLAAFDVTTGNLLPWAPVLSSGGTVSSVLAIGDTLYFGGVFSSVGGVPRAAIASVHGTTGALTSWNPAPVAPGGTTQAIAALATGNNSILVLGRFTHIGGADRTGLAALDPITAEAGPWNPGVPIDFGALAVGGDMVYVGGNFLSVGGTTRKYLAKISLTTGALQPWLSEDPDDFVHALAIVGNTVYVGGQFGSVGGASHVCLAAFDATTGAPASGNFAADGEVDALAAGAGTVGVGGGFTIGAGITRNNLAGFVQTSQALLFFNPDVSGPVNSIDVSASTVYFGGEFTHVGGSVRIRLAAQDLSLGLRPWSPTSSQTVRAIAVRGSTVYVGGDFAAISGVPHKFLAATDAATGAVASWSPAVDGPAYLLRVFGGAIFAGGAFTDVGGTAAGNLALIDATTGGVTAVPAGTPSGDIQAVADAGGNVYVGGKFASIGGSARTQLAAFDGAGTLLPWNPSVTAGDLPAAVRALAVVSDTLYVAGEFNAIGGQPRLRLAALDLVSGTPFPWTADAGGVLSTLASDGSRLLAGGQPGSIGMVPRGFLAAFDAGSGDVRPWSVALDADVLSLCVSGGRLYAGGAFTTLAGNPMQDFAVLDTATGTPLASDMSLDGPVEAILASAGRVYLGGRYGTIAGLSRSCLAALDSVSLAVAPWNPGANSDVLTLAAANNVIYAGGMFALCGHTTRRAIAAIDPVTGLATTWNPGSQFGAVVNAIAVDRGVVYVGGQFFQMAFEARSGLAALDPVTGLATGWNPSVGGPVTALSAGDGTVFVATQQPQFITFSESTAQPGSWLPAPDGVIHAIFRANGTIDLGGSFQVIAGEPRPSFAAFADPAFVPTLDVPRPGQVARLELAQNRPNPFRSGTTIRFVLPAAGRVRLRVVDIGGRLVRTLLETEAMEAGEHEVRIDAAGLSPGLYWYRLETNLGVTARRMVVLQ
jgi:hypothetical protein